MVSEKTYLFAGLGNPGSAYDGTRHNVGFQIVDAIAASVSESLHLTKWDACYCRVSLWGAKIYLVKPQTYMNLSGRSVVRFVDFFKISPDNVLVVHDDIDMRPGRVKLVAGGGPGGHNGIRSLIECLGSRDFFRLKYGVGRPGQNGIHGEIPVDRYVLGSFTGEEEELLAERMPALLKGLKSFVGTGSQQAMNILNAIK